MKKKVLLIAYNFPPERSSSGSLRTLKFVQYLPNWGYEPIVLTLNTRALESVDESLIPAIPPMTIVHRSFALSTKKHLSIRGAYLELMALPDRWASWIPTGIFDGIQLIKRYNIDLIFSSYPIASAHLIGTMLNRITQKPWVAEFRDPMYGDFSTSPLRSLKVQKRIETSTVRRANHIVVATEGMLKLFQQRYPFASSSRLSVILNGYDEDDFRDVSIDNSVYKNGAPVRLLYAGSLDLVHRNPLPFFHGIRIMLDRGWTEKHKFVVDLFVPEDSNLYYKELEKLGLSDVVKLHCAIPYKAILKEMGSADILLLFQGRAFDNQIPAKVYEYLRTGKPILALTTLDGQTGKMIASNRAGEVVPNDDNERIATVLSNLLSLVRDGGQLPRITLDRARCFSRRAQTEELVEIFNKVLTN